MRAMGWTLGLVWSAITVGACDGGEVDTDPADTDTAPAGWTTVAENLPGALLAITGSSPDDVWAVGSDGDGSGPMLVHYDGAAWERRDLGFNGDMWWVWQAGPDALFLVGAGGKVVQYTPSTGEHVDTVLDENVTLFGVWGSGPDDVYAVGGNINVSEYGAAVWHFDGVAWTRTDIPSDADQAVAMYKVWGRSASDVWICGANGIVLHHDGSAWTSLPTGTSTSLFTVQGVPDGEDVYVVGGAGNGMILHWDGAAFSDESPGFAQTIQGISASEGTPVAAGWGGYIYNRDTPANLDDADPLTSVWTEDARGSASFQDFHAVWQDGAGGTWAVGGAIRSSPLTQGTLVYGGDAPPAAYAP